MQVTAAAAPAAAAAAAAAAAICFDAQAAAFMGGLCHPDSVRSNLGGCLTAGLCNLGCM